LTVYYFVVYYYRTIEKEKAMPKTMDELMRAILNVLPHATFEEDNDGQVIIYTGLQETKDGLVEFDLDSNE